ncbi:hypothetical protein L486_03270 [Kwoniella mangroviensis CBS 10435]|uniref:Uncharacterized protein n=1 Tax=Kwoniella mangroviensis CBS 10435 TaxID=1331196 RepID=A0A1B9ITG3_9TREE|nr:uncharacterized protein I203_01952 [Kwoniella mangroviensis CBS 8507]OCF58780.1 hypothetical protein L486_03270 [Kwoniella mangroviensis CBS 10435]OCF68569.1 hypothetical protein I203_01952 [Kwoniella mangroviensis CBS 8507]OCF76971.1 hypothetical protein I204_02680 [Kwoniella mangroviensis CBS 8886]
MILRHRYPTTCSITIVLFILFTFLLCACPILASPEPQPIYIPRSLQSNNKRAESNTKARPNPNRPEYVAHPAGDLVCRPFGECEPCPRDELDQPFCFPFGNRRLLHCIPSSSAEEAKNGNHVGEVPAWEACGKVVRKERQDFWEFVTANLLFLIVALTILWARTSALATEQYRQLAARIGIPSGGWT